MKKLFIIDGSSYFYRAYYAIKNLSNKEGFPTNAIYGFVKMILKVSKDYNPDFLVIAFDSRGKGFRNELFQDYKATRKKMPDDLSVQLPYIFDIVNGFNIPNYTLDKYEADDIIATLCSLVKGKKEIETYIVTGDKDLCQLVNHNTFVLDTMKDKLFNAEEVEKKFGIPPNRLLDFLALTGDSSDNIPGVKGIGPKTTIKLLQEFGSLDEVYENIDKIKPERIKNLLINEEENARLSYKLATLDFNTPIEINIESLHQTEPDYDKLKKLFTKFEFVDLIKQIMPAQSLSNENYKTIYSVNDLKQILDQIEKSNDAVCVDTETTSLDPTDAILVGVSLCSIPGHAYYIPLKHKSDSLMNTVRNVDQPDVAIKLIEGLLKSNIKKIFHNAKYDLQVLKNIGISDVNNYEDTIIMSYLINPSRRSHSLDYLAVEFLSHNKIKYEDVAGKGKKAVRFDNVDVDTATKYSCEDVDVTRRLFDIFLTKLRTNELEDLYHNIEKPLIEILCEMEGHGVFIDKSYLVNLSKIFDGDIKKLKQEIYSISGTEFNLNSPKQLQSILFDKMGLSPAKKTKTGYSTNVEVLETLAQDHEICRLILNYRTISKLKRTYSDSLVDAINKKTGRVHTSYNQTVTSTGRLSSSNPNLQNIPIRTEEGKKIRQAFISIENAKLISADYSQIELRILAALAGEQTLLNAFQNDKDIHALTASEIFSIPLDEVTPEFRRRAKVINFGLIYGMGPFGLAKQLGIPNYLAKDYINAYFDKYSGIKKYFDKVVKDAKETGYVSTMFGRRRYIPEINSKNKQVQSFAVRTAINMPIQGTSADMMKIAMINIHNEFKKQNLASYMIMQVHDEVVIETFYNEIEKVAEITKKFMENAVSLSVPIKVDLKIGKNWNEMEHLEI